MWRRVRPLKRSMSWVNSVLRQFLPNGLNIHLLFFILFLNRYPYVSEGIWDSWNGSCSHQFPIVIIHLVPVCYIPRVETKERECWTKLRTDRKKGFIFRWKGNTNKLRDGKALMWVGHLLNNIHNTRNRLKKLWTFQ